jgi:hypothetical protein
MIERWIIRSGIIFGIVSFPTLFRKRPRKLWVSLFLINCIVNYAFNKSLVTTKKIKYPVRFLPKIFKINFVYDYLVCPYLSIWYCRSTYNSNISGVLGKLLLWGLPQAAYEIWLEKRTKLMEFKGNWKWFHSLFLVFVVKLLSRGVLEVLKGRIIKHKNLHPLIK